MTLYLQPFARWQLCWCSPQYAAAPWPWPLQIVMNEWIYASWPYIVKFGRLEIDEMPSRSLYRIKTTCFAGVVPNLHFAPTGPIAHKIFWALLPIDPCMSVVRIGWDLPELFPNDWFFKPPKSLQPTVIIRRTILWCLEKPDRCA